MQKIAYLQGEVKHYDWGGTQYIPSLLKTDNSAGKPFAEYWMGAHPGADCKVIQEDNSILLKELVEQDKMGILGKKVQQAFGQFPYLLKVLDVKDMLSIQVHPEKALAAIDFEAENKKGIPLNASDRNYKDANHKPELMVALSDFYLLHGFKPEAALLEAFNKTKELAQFTDVYLKDGYAGMYQWAMEMPQQQVNELLTPLLERIIPLYNQGLLKKEQEDFWAARAALTFNKSGIIDRGIFSVYFFNLLHLTRGEAIFQKAGLPHAYLEGQNVEIMASSDNVLRGGLTNKHINTAELLRHTKCEPTFPQVIPYKDKLETVYATPVQDFELLRYHLDTNSEIAFTTRTAEIFLLLNGEVELSDGRNKVHLKDNILSAIAFAHADIIVNALAKDTILYRATVPVSLI